MEPADAYFAFKVKAKGVVRNTEWKHRADLNKVKEFCKEQHISLALRFGREAFYGYRRMAGKERVQNQRRSTPPLTVCKQVFKWGHAEGRLKEYRLINTKLAEAKAKPQPCFTTEQVEQLINATTGVEQAAHRAHWPTPACESAKQNRCFAMTFARAITARACSTSAWVAATARQKTKMPASCRFTRVSVP